MYAYDFRLAWHSIRRNPGLSALMVLAIALGIAVCTVTFTVYHAMATNPIPQRSGTLHAVTLDTWDPKEPYEDDHPESPPLLMTYRDATHLYESKAAPRSLIHVTTPTSAWTIFTSAPAGLSAPITQEIPAITIRSRTKSASRPASGLSPLTD